MFIGYDQHPRAYFFWDVWEGNMRVSEKVLSCVCFLGRDDSGSFLAYGTGFFAVVATGERLFQHIVAARHVIENINFDPICVRLNRSDGRIEHTYADRKHWVFHPDPAVDIAVCPTHVPPESYDIKHVHLGQEVATPEVFEDEKIGVGDDVFMAGMFTRHIGETSNDPIVRIGTIAGLPAEKVQTDRGLVYAYFVEVRSIAGLSGSPVFVHMAPLRVMADGEVRRSEKRTHYFLGVMQGHHVSQDPTDVASPDDYTPGDMNTGIGVVIPAERIIEVIDLPVLRTEREMIAEKKRKESGFVPDSTGHKKPPTTDENPQHREDFNRLLDAAMSGNKQGSETS